MELGHGRYIHESAVDILIKAAVLLNSSSLYTFDMDAVFPEAKKLVLEFYDIASVPITVPQLLWIIRSKEKPRSVPTLITRLRFIAQAVPPRDVLEETTIEIVKLVFHNIIPQTPTTEISSINLAPGPALYFHVPLISCFTVRHLCKLMGLDHLAP